tara:strand:+ start:446 stop:856 length:411 start_codon:yes stop_codon:yes gene_type:complete
VRISWEQYALDIAQTASSRSEDRYVKVGACALNSQQMVVAVGYNGLASGKDVSYDFWRNRDHRRKFMIHAEVNCLSLFKKGEAQMLAVTLLPCSACATMIAAYGISKVIYRDVYERDTSALEILDFYNIECIKYGN